MRVLVTGANGGVGSTIIDQLGNTDVEVRATCRRPDRRRWPSVDAVPSDLDEPQTLRPALEGVDAVFLVSFAQPEVLPDLVEEMAAAGVHKVVVLSTIDTTRTEPFVEYNKQRHLAVENAAIDGGFDTVCLRPGAFARNAIRFWAGQIREHRRVGLPFPDSHQAPIADEDIATVAVTALTTSQLDGQKVVLTGPHSLSMREQVGLIGRAVTESIDITVLSDTQARALYGQVLPPQYLDLLMAQWAFEVTEPAEVTDAVPTITGRKAVTFGDWATGHRDAFLSAWTPGTGTVG
ncbi:MAG: NAD(P)H-binding protein [Mycobacterium kyogaense]|uniref:SDR family oxidoreductase n=1 Tax=Mycobacterium kyogaense TaxID=2212479 RepID=UPI002FFA18D2